MKNSKFSQTKNYLYSSRKKLLKNETKKSLHESETNLFLIKCLSNKN